MEELENLKVGDLVVVGIGDKYDEIKEVAWISDDWIQAGLMVFNKKTGKLIVKESILNKRELERSGFTTIRPASEESKERVRRNTTKLLIVKFLNNIQWEDISLETLLVVQNIVKEKGLAIVPQNNKTIAYERNVVSKGTKRSIGSVL